MSLSSRRWIAAKVAVLLFLLPVVADAEPRIGLDDGGLTFHGAAAGTTEVAWLGISRGIERQVSVRRVVQAVSLDDDGDGVFRLELAEEVPIQSVWVAVGLPHGETAVLDVLELYHEVETEEEGGDGGVVGEDKALGGPGRGLGRARTDATGGRVIVPAPYAELVLARPGGGVWSARAGDGTELDAGPPGDGEVALPLARLAALAGVTGAESPPGRLAAGDVLVLLEPRSLGWSVATLAEVP